MTTMCREMKMKEKIKAEGNLDEHKQKQINSMMFG